MADAGGGVDADSREPRCLPPIGSDSEAAARWAIAAQ
jgi:hypothetical protein